MKIQTGTFNGNGTFLDLTTGLPAQLVMLFSNQAVTTAHWGKNNWNERTNFYGPATSAVDGIGYKDDGFMVGNIAQVNSNGIVSHWIQFYDPTGQEMELVSWQGNGLTGRVVPLKKQATPLCVIGKRDSAAAAVIRASGSANGADMGGAGVSGAIASINSGNFTVSNGSNINQYAAKLGEGTAGHVFYGGLNSTVVKWTGDGSASRAIPTGLTGNIKFALVWREDAAMVPVIKTDTMGPGEADPVTAAVFVTNTLDFSGANLVTGTTTTLNANTGSYSALVFTDNDGATAVYSPEVLSTRPSSGRKMIDLPGRGVSSYIDCGVSNTLQFSGAYSCEWFGRVFYRDTKVPTGPGVDIAALIARIGGPIETSGNLSFGEFVHRPDETGGDMGAQFNLGVTNDFVSWIAANFTDAGDIYRTGILLPSGHRDFHYVHTHDGSGKHNLWVNGKLRKNRVIDMVAARTKPNIQGGSGHRTVIGCFYDGTTFTNFQRMQFGRARLYTSELSNANIDALYRRVARGETGVADVAGFLEEWDAANAVGSSLPATVNSANNGTINNGTIITR